MTYLFQFIMGFGSCIGFGYIFNGKPKTTFIGSVAGGFGWLGYLISVECGFNVMISSLIGSIILSLLCEGFARMFKDAVVVFLIPAILPLVPGAGLYLTMRYLINGTYDIAISKGVETLGCAVAIAIGILIASFLTGLVTKIKLKGE